MFENVVCKMLSISSRPQFINVVLRQPAILSVLAKRGAIMYRQHAASPYHMRLCFLI